MAAQGAILPEPLGRSPSCQERPGINSRIVGQPEIRYVLFTDIVDSTAHAPTQAA